MSGPRLFRDEWLCQAVPQPALAPLIEAARAAGQPWLSSALVASGAVHARDIGSHVELRFGVPFVTPTLAGLDRLAIQLVPEKVCRRHAILPLRLEEETLVLAMANPLDAVAQSDATFVSGRPVRPCFSIASRLQDLLRSLYGSDPGARGDARSVLVVDDQAPVRSMVRRLLEPGGTQVREAADGLEALAELSKDPPDLLVLDLDMPKLDGFGVVMALRFELGLWEVPVLILTGAGSAESQSQALRLGADDYVTKPFDGKVLLARIEAVFRRSRIRDLGLRAVFGRTAGSAPRPEGAPAPPAASSPHR